MKNTTWHETGHAIFAKIFDDYLFIEIVTIEPTNGDKGGNIIKTIREEESEHDDFHFIIVCLAGLVVELMQNDRENEKKLMNILAQSTKRLNNKTIKDTFRGDFELIQEPLNRLSEKTQISKDMILAKVMIFISNCLLKTSEFWSAIDILARELDKKITLNTDEINTILDNCGFNQYLKEGKSKFIEETIELLKPS